MAKKLTAKNPRRRGRRTRILPLRRLKIRLSPLLSRLSYLRSLVPRPGRRIRRQLKFVFLFLLLAIFGTGGYLLWDLPDPMQLTANPAAASTKILDRHGLLLFEIFGAERRTPIQFSTLPDHVWQSTLAAEDKDFYRHRGFSPTGFIRAAFHTLTGQRLEGGSTITQQLVKKALLSDDRTIARKIRELVLSLLVETRYSKNQILEMYLNQIPYGGTAYGLESAAQTYFGISAAHLSPAQSALLAALPQAPSYYSPFGSNPEIGRERQQYILSQMRDLNYLTPDQYASAAAETLKFAPPPAIKAPHFSLWVKDLLVNKYGLETVESGGLTVITTLDLDLQTFAQAVVATETAKLIKEKVSNGAALVTRPITGEILAMVGSRDYFDTDHDGNVNVTRARRQPGSAIKPVNYAIAIEHKLITASTVLSDKPTCFIQPRQENYCPDNYDYQFHGPTQVRFALGNSFNIPAVKALVLNGLTDFIATSSAFGISTWQNPDQYGPALTLGGGEVTMMELSTAYSVLSNQGRRVNPNPILQITDRFGNILESVNSRPLPPKDQDQTSPYFYFTVGEENFLTSPPPDIRVISAGAAYIVTHILYDNGARSATFGSSSYLNIKGHPEVSVKTGTTNNKRDNWTVGYNPDILTAVWVGNNDNTPMADIASGVTGASPIWNRIMTYALTDLPQHWPPQPAGVVGALVCQLSGLRAPESPAADCFPRYEYFLTGTFPPYESGNRRDIPVFRPTQTPATSKQLTENPDQIEYQNHAVIFDPLGTALCLDCAGGYGGPDNIVLDQNGKAVTSR